MKDDIEQIGENYSVQTLKILDNIKDFHSIHYLLKKYPNLTNLSVKTNYCGGIFFIKEESNSKIDKLDLDLDGLVLSQMIICGPFENLKTFKLVLPNETELKNFPLFLDKCEVSFKSLSEFYLKTIHNDIKPHIDMLENLYKNIDFMPNLKNFTLIFDTPVEKDFYLNFVKKILSLNLNKIYFFMMDVNYQYIFENQFYEDIYSFDEIEAICPGVNCYKYEKLFIKKYIQS